MLSRSDVLLLIVIPVSFVAVGVLSVAIYREIKRRREPRIVELCGGPYDGHEVPIFPPDVADYMPPHAVKLLRDAAVRGYAECPRCGKRHDLWQELPPRLVPTTLDSETAIIVPHIPAPGVQPRRPAARYAFLEVRGDRLVYEYRESAPAVWLAPQPEGVDPCTWDPSR